MTEYHYIEIGKMDKQVQNTPENKTKEKRRKKDAQCYVGSDSLIIKLTSLVLERTRGIDHKGRELHIAKISIPCQLLY
jgi:hypothetical protein